MSKLYVVGIGPGKKEGLTIEAFEVLKSCKCIVGYKVYNDLVKQYLPDKEYIFTEMKKEQERVELAIQKAVEYGETALICSGDAEVYGLAGLVFELADSNEFKSELEIKVIPGVSAAFSGGALLGAPLGHDFVVISLSDLLTPLSLIEKRLELAASGDFAICLYNPSSKKRADYLKKACDICLKYKGENTVCGIAVNVGREGEKTKTLTLKELRDTEVDMFTTVFIGNSKTKDIEGFMVTPRGYLQRDELLTKHNAETQGSDADRYTVLSDEHFLRNEKTKVPMTKYPVRVVSVNELNIQEKSICYDIGAGTGSVTVEMARRATCGKVYAVEKKPEAVEILRDNLAKFNCNNVEIVQGEAPDAIDKLPAPDCVFIGGSSGKLKDIVMAIRKKNANARFVVTAITLETLGQLLEISKEIQNEIPENISKDIPEYNKMKLIQLSATEVKNVADMHMMSANNPVFIGTFGG